MPSKPAGGDISPNTIKEQPRYFIFALLYIKTRHRTGETPIIRRQSNEIKNEYKLTI